MKITQISVFLENKKGRLHEIASLFGKNSINIRALAIAESKDFGVLKVIVDKTPEAVALLKKSGFVSRIADVVVAMIDDAPGGLAKVLKALCEANINVEYMYGFVKEYRGKVLLALRFDNPDKAIEVLTASKVKLLGKNELAGF